MVTEITHLPRYIGDISRNDAALLARYATQAKRILEFGPGASTQVLARALDGGELVSIETEPEWIGRAQRNLTLLGIQRPVEFVVYKGWQGHVRGEFDVIFNDGADRYRTEFARAAWPLLRVGGVMLFHDTRRERDARAALELAAAFFLEVETVSLNEAASNITAIRKKLASPWEDWNVVEGRKRWEYGHSDPPPELWGDDLQRGS